MCFDVLGSTIGIFSINKNSLGESLELESKKTSYMCDGGECSKEKVMDVKRCQCCYVRKLRFVQRGRPAFGRNHASLRELALCLG